VSIKEGVSQEGLIRRVLEQTPHEVPHSWYQVTQWNVHAYQVATGGERMSDRVSHTVQNLDLEILRRKTPFLGVTTGM
jgi:hypothetical protein